MAFLEHFEGLCTEECCGIMLKKPDKKKERLDMYLFHTRRANDNQLNLMLI